MAIIYPDSCPSQATSGENDLFQALCCNLPDDFYVWYEPHSESQRPDFLLLSPTFGILVLKVKDWRLDTILEANPDKFIITSSNTQKPETEPSPLRQSQSYTHKIMSRLKSYPILVHADGPYQGRMIFPMSYGVVMTNITEAEAKESGLDKILTYPKVVYREEFLSWQAIEDQDLIKRLLKMFARPFKFDALTADQINTIKGIIYPEIVIRQELAQKSSIPENQTLVPDSTILITLDNQQESHAHRLGEGHRIIFGVAGSGKTLILLAKAKLLAKQNPNHQILILCYNVNLAAHLNSIIGDYPNIKILHFHAFAKSFVSRLPKIDESNTENYDDHIGDLLLEKLAKTPLKKKYDSILIDEGHTFPANWFQCCLAALKDSDNGNLVIVGDGSQKIYKRKSFTWKSIGIKAQGRTVSKRFNLDVNYRNTVEILTTSLQILKQLQAIPNQNNDDEDEELISFPIIQPKDALRHGAIPVLHLGKYQMRHVLTQVKQLINQGYQPQDIAILYRQSNDDDKKTLKNICNLLNEAGFQSYWITENRNAKLSYNANTPGVRVSTILSTLGLEFKVVIMMWIEKFNDDLMSNDLETRQTACCELYVGLTRAQEVLHLYGAGTVAFVQKLTQLDCLSVVNN